MPSRAGASAGPQAPKESGEHLVDVSHQRPEEAAVRCRRRPSSPQSRLRKAQPQTPPVERVGEGHLGCEQLDASCRQADTPKEGRGRHQRVDRRANVIVKAWERRFGRAAASARSRFSFVDLDRKTGASQGRRGGQPVGPEPMTTASSGGTIGTVAGPPRRALVLAGARGCPSTPRRETCCLMAQFTRRGRKMGAMVPRGSGE